MCTAFYYYVVVGLLLPGYSSTLFGLNFFLAQWNENTRAVGNPSTVCRACIRLHKHKMPNAHTAHTTTTIAPADRRMPITDPMTDPSPAHRADHRKCRTAHFKKRNTSRNTRSKTKARGADTSLALATLATLATRASDNRRASGNRNRHAKNGSPAGSSSSFATKNALWVSKTPGWVFTFPILVFGAAAESGAPRTRRRGYRAVADARARRTTGRGRAMPRASPSPTIPTMRQRQRQRHKPPPISIAPAGPSGPSGGPRSHRPHRPACTKHKTTIPCSPHSVRIRAMPPSVVFTVR